MGLSDDKITQATGLEKAIIEKLKKLASGNTN